MSPVLAQTHCPFLLRHSHCTDMVDGSSLRLVCAHCPRKADAKSAAQLRCFCEVWVKATRLLPVSVPVLEGSHLWNKCNLFPCRPAFDHSAICIYWIWCIRKAVRVLEREQQNRPTAHAVSRQWRQQKYWNWVKPLSLCSFGKETSAYHTVWLSWNSMCRPDWSQTCANLLASAFWVLAL